VDELLSVMIPPKDCYAQPLRDCNGDCLVNAANIQCNANEMLNQ
jgi:hypothetical protein